jgi:tripartite-type tricarboxylate transporter receptor subunit TctC
VKIVVPFGAGGTSDLAMRKLADLLEKKWRSSVIVENRPGAGTTIGATEVARAEPDGHTLLLAPSTTLAIMPLLKKNLSYDPQKDFTPVTGFVEFPLTIVARKDLPATNLKELVELSKKEKIRYGSHGPGSAPHLILELFKKQADVDISHIPYSGGAETHRALAASEVDLTVSGAFSATNLVNAGTAKVLAVDNMGSPLLPDVKTFKEQGFPDMQAFDWWAIVAPAGVPRPVVDKLNADIRTALDDPSLRDYLVKGGYEPAGSSPDDLSALMKSTVDVWKPLLKAEAP